MRVLVIDGQGGGLGRQIVAAVKEKFPEVEVLAAGANSAATNAMLRAGGRSGGHRGKRGAGSVPQSRCDPGTCGDRDRRCHDGRDYTGHGAGGGPEPGKKNLASSGAV